MKVSTNFYYEDNGVVTKLFCSICNTELITVYDSLEQDRRSSPLEMTEIEKRDLQESYNILTEILQHLSQTKQERILQSRDLNEDLQIYFCQTCRKIYDTLQLERKEIGHGHSNLLPFKNINQHSIVSDDLESLEAATSAKHENKQEIFVPSLPLPSQQNANAHLRHLQNVKIKSGTKFKLQANHKDLEHIEHAKRDVKALVDKYGEKNVNIKINLSSSSSSSSNQSSNQSSN